MKTYHANASRNGRFWLVHIPEIDQYTQGRNLAEVEPMARDLIALWLEIPEDSFDVAVHVELPKDVQHHLELAAKYAHGFRSCASASSSRTAHRCTRVEGERVNRSRHRRGTRRVVPARSAARVGIATYGRCRAVRGLFANLPAYRLAGCQPLSKRPPEVAAMQ